MSKKLYERKISFIDANNERVNLEIEITDRNNTETLSICSQSGQGKFVPDTDEQKGLLDIWNTYHLNGMSPGTDKQNTILKNANAGNDYDVRCNELRNYDFNGDFMLDMNKRNLAKFAEIEYHDLITLIQVVKSCIKYKTRDCDKKYYDLLMKIIEEDCIQIKFTNSSNARNRISFKEGFNGGILSFDFSGILNSNSIQNQILISIEKRINNFPMDNLSAYFDVYEGKLIRYGCTWVTRDLPEDLSKTLDTLCDEIEEDMKSKTLVSDLTYEQFAAQYPDFDNPEKVYALACNREGYLDSLENVTERYNTFYFEGDDWLVCTDEEANEEHLDYIKSIFDDIGGFDGFRQSSVCTSIELDESGWGDGDIIISKSITIPANERGESLNHYDGYEHDISVNGTTYYIYQQ